MKFAESDISLSCMPSSLYKPSLVSNGILIYIIRAPIWYLEYTNLSLLV